MKVRSFTLDIELSKRSRQKKKDAKKQHKTGDAELTAEQLANWNSRSKENQEQYLRDHPASQFANHVKKMNEMKGNKDDEDLKQTHEEPKSKEQKEDADDAKTVMGNPVVPPTDEERQEMKKDVEKTREDIKSKLGKSTISLAVSAMTKLGTKGVGARIWDSKKERESDSDLSPHEKDALKKTLATCVLGAAAIAGIAIVGAPVAFMFASIWVKDHGIPYHDPFDTESKDKVKKDKEDYDLKLETWLKKNPGKNESDFIQFLKDKEEQEKKKRAEREVDDTDMSDVAEPKYTDSDLTDEGKKKKQQMEDAERKRKQQEAQKKNAENQKDDTSDAEPEVKEEPKKEDPYKDVVADYEKTGKLSREMRDKLLEIHPELKNNPLKMAELISKLLDRKNLAQASDEQSELDSSNDKIDNMLYQFASFFKNADQKELQRQLVALQKQRRS